MRDCANVDMREALPDLVNGGLPVARRAEVEAHLAECADCRAELAIIESARRLLARAPAIGVARIVERLPVPRRTPSWRPHLWRIAAAIALVTLAGTAIVRRDAGSMRSADVARTASPEQRPASAPVIAGAPSGSARRGSTVTSGPETLALSLGGDLSDLSDEQVRQLLGAVEALEPVPSAELETEMPVWADVLPDEEGA